MRSELSPRGFKKKKKKEGSLISPLAWKTRCLYDSTKHWSNCTLSHSRAYVSQCSCTKTLSQMPGSSWKWSVTQVTVSLIQTARQKIFQCCSQKGNNILHTVHILFSSLSQQLNLNDFLFNCSMKSLNIWSCLVLVPMYHYSEF